MPDFVPTKLEEDRSDTKDMFTVRLNKEQRIRLDACKSILEQPKDSTALKQLAWIGANAIHDDLMANIISVIFKNKRKNKRIGIVDFED